MIEESDRIAVVERLPSDSAPVEIDQLDFNKPPFVRITKYWSGLEAPNYLHATAKLFWSAEALLIFFNCSQKRPPVVNPEPETKSKTIGLWKRDVCEFFVSPDPNDLNHYFEFEAAPTGEWLDLAITLTSEGRLTDWNFESGMSVETSTKGAETLLLGMRLPWKAFGKMPLPGEVWRGNLFRCAGKGDRGYLAWQPTNTPKPDFHVPAAFGWIRFDG